MTARTRDGELRKGEPSIEIERDSQLNGVEVLVSTRRLKCELFVGGEEDLPEFDGE